MFVWRTAVWIIRIQLWFFSLFIMVNWSQIMDVSWLNIGFYLRTPLWYWVSLLLFFLVIIIYWKGIAAVKFPNFNFKNDFDKNRHFLLFPRCCFVCIHMRGKPIEILSGVKNQPSWMMSFCQKYFDYFNSRLKIFNLFLEIDDSHT